MMIGRLGVFSSVVLAASLGAVLNGCGSDDDTTGTSGGHSAKGGGAGRGGTSGRGGSVASGGTGGSLAGAGGTSGTGTTTGGSGGAAIAGGAGTGATSGGSSLGGMAGTVAMAGGGGTGGAPSYCYEALYAPIAMENDQVDFEVDYSDASPVNLSATTLSVRLRAETLGNAGGIQ